MSYFSVVKRAGTHGHAVKKFGHSQYLLVESWANHFSSSVSAILIMCAADTMVLESIVDLIAILEQEEIQRLTGGKLPPEFGPGDTVVVNVNVVEGTRKRVQAYEGVVIGRRNRGLNSSFIVRKISSGEAVERTFQLYSPQIASIEVKRRGAVRRAKLYYLRDRSGKAARIKEKLVRRSGN